MLQSIGAPRPHGRGWFIVYSLLIGIGSLLSVMHPTFASNSCTDRQQVCQAYCEKTEPNSPGCLLVCKSYRDKCLSSGCWESKVAAKRCGFTKE
jgi:hypothetical protein